MVLVIIKNWDHTKESLLAPGNGSGGAKFFWDHIAAFSMNIWMPSWDRVRDIVGGVTTVIRTIIDVIKDAVD